MKKISFFLIVCAIAVLAACSNEETTNFGSEGSGFKQKNIATLTALYTKMVNSQSYKNEHAALNQFVAKLNFNGNPSDIQGDIENDMLLWISNNLSTTSFTSYGAAVNEWENVVALGMISYQKNIAFYNEVRVNPGQYPNIIPPVNVPVTPNACPTCKTAFIECTKEANNKYANNIETILNDLGDGNITLNQTIKNIKKADFGLALHLKICNFFFIACCI